MQTQHTLVTHKHTALTEGIKKVERNALEYSTISSKTLQCLDDKDKKYTKHLHC